MNPAYKIPELSGYDKRIVDEFRNNVHGLSELALRTILNECCVELGSVYARYTIEQMLGDAVSSIRSNESK